MKIAKILLPVGMVLVFGGACLVLEDWPFDNFPNPNAPDEVGVFIANGIFDAADTSFELPTGDDFDREIMGRNDQQIAARKQQAVDYFLKRFGVDFSQGDFDQDGAVGLFHSYQDPRWNYRCYSFPGRRVPRAGLIVHDAQWVMAVVGSEAVFSGTWGGAEGTVVPAGTVAVNGEYLIQATNQFRQNHPRNIHLRFESVEPIFNAASGNIKFDCRLDHEILGLGAALGRQEVYALADGNTQINITNVLQFPPPAWARD